MPRGLVVAAILLAALGVLCGLHYFLYRSAVHFFAVTDKWPRRALAALFVLLPASFFAALFLSRRFENNLVRGFTIVADLWLGVGLALILFFVMAWAAWGVAMLRNPRPSPAWFGFAVVLLVSVYSAYGIWNAYHPRVVNVTVRLGKLPPAWQGAKLVQISDLHLGLILNSGFMRDVNAPRPDAVLITGDLFEGEDRSLDRFVEPLNAISAPRGVYFVTGNHETYLGVDRALAALAKTKVRALNDEMEVVEGLQIIGVSYPLRGFSKDIAGIIGRLPGFDRDKPTLLLYHSPTQIAEVKSAGVNLQVSGHTHHGQMFPITPITRLIYGRYDHGLNLDGDFAVYTSTGTGTWGPMMRTGNHPEITVIRLEPK
jgi:predicted MPP superfamily phosphohydrolase